jgi:hypothetical protein
MKSCLYGWQEGQNFAEERKSEKLGITWPEYFSLSSHCPFPPTISLLFA